jgi:ABC-type multidrug transport system ATPase subunit
MIHTLSRFATTHGTIIITSIHQPGYSTWNLFDSCVLLSSGKVCYEGETGGLEGFLKLIGVEVDRHVSRDSSDEQDERQEEVGDEGRP